MRRAAGLAAPLLAVVLGMVIPPAPPVEGGSANDSIRIGLADTITRGIPPSWTQLAMRPFKALMEAQTGMTGELVMGRDALTLARDLNDGKIQVAVLHGFEFAWAKQKHPKLAVIALCVNKVQEAKVHLVVRSDSRATSYLDLKGRSITVPRMGRGNCQLYFERCCVKPGVKPEKFYRRIDRPFATNDALEDVVDGEHAAVVIDAVSLDDYRKSRPVSGRRLRSIAESDPLPCGVIAYCPGKLPQAQANRFRAGLLGAKSTAHGRDTLKMLRLTCFEPPPANHDAILAAVAKAYPAP